MKKCARCRRSKPLAEFTKNRARADGLNHTCRGCHRRYVRAHYKKNSASYVAKAALAREDLKNMVRELKGKPCADCAKTFPYYVMDFDHVRGTKLFTLGEAPARRGRDQILEEAAKCDVVCSNCHRIRTHKRLNAHNVRTPIS